MAEENQAREPGQEQEQTQETKPAQEPAEENRDKPAEKKSGGGLLMPVLYALLAAVGAFTLVMIIGIAVTLITRPAQPSESPSVEPSSQSTPSPTRAQRSPDGDGFYADAASKDVTSFFLC